MKLFFKIIGVIVAVYLLIGIIVSFTIPAANPYNYDHANGNKKYISIPALVETTLIWPLYFLIRIH